MSERSVTTAEFGKMLAAMLDAVNAGRGAEPRYRNALLAALTEVDIEIGGVQPSKRDYMKESDVIAWAIRACAPNATPNDMGSLRHAVEKLLAGKHAGAYGQCSQHGSERDPCPERCASGTCFYAVRETEEADPFTWVTRTWVDVREGDVIRPPGVDGAEARVAAIGPVVAWGVDDLQPLDAYQRRDIQYNPSKYAGSYAVRRATFGDPPITRDMKPGADVDIRVSLAELKAIEALGGWAERVAVIDNPE